MKTENSGVSICISCGWKGLDTEVIHYYRREYFGDIWDDKTGKHEYIVNKCPKCGMEESIREVRVRPI
jgi:predicted RNA-binding Zn-ribbon protein involved in translation (DUF1610 family)